MKKRLFFLVALMAAFMSVNAATDRLMATLQKGDNVDVFYGINAFMQAMEKVMAEEGDATITLSEGEFYTGNNANFNNIKNLKIQGAGYGLGLTFNSSYANVCFTLNGDAESIEFDGINFGGYLYIYGNIKNCTFRRCKISNIYIQPNSDTKSENVTIDQCRIRYLNIGQESKNMVISNSAIDQLLGGSQESNVQVEHCFIRWLELGSNNPTFPNCRNCIVREVRGSSAEGAILFNSLYYNKSSSDPILATCRQADFISNPNMFDWEKECKLTDEQIAEYADVCTDGTQVGIYGGIGFSEDPTNPKITSTDISREATYDEANDKYTLNVKFTVETQE